MLHPLNELFIKMEAMEQSNQTRKLLFAAPADGVSPEDLSPHCTPHMDKDTSWGGNKNSSRITFLYVQGTQDNGWERCHNSYMNKPVLSHVKMLLGL